MRETQDRGEDGAALVIRAWYESPDQRGVRVRITSTLDVATGDQRTQAVATAQEVYAAVRDWFEAFLARLAAPDETVDPGSETRYRR